MMAKRAAVSAHLYAQVTDFMLAGGIEQTRQHSQHCGYDIHQTPSVQGMLCYDDVRPDFASIGRFWQREYVAPRERDDALQRSLNAIGRPERGSRDGRREQPTMTGYALNIRLRDRNPRPR